MAATRDLHLHTLDSDGRLTPTELVQMVAKNGLKTISVTDHDSTEGLAEAFEAAKQFPDLRIIPGIEMSADLPGDEVHVLGYFLDYHTAPRRQYSITLLGEIEVGTPDGTVKRYGPGTVLMAEDLTGTGHSTRVVSAEPRFAIIIPLAD